MKMEKEQDYLFVPIMLLRDMITEPEKTIADILVSGIYNRSKTLEFNFESDEEVENYLLSQFAYAYVNERDTMPESLICEIESLDNYELFKHNGFEPNDMIEALDYIFTNNDTNDEIKNGAIAFSRVRECIRRFELKDYLNRMNVNLSIEYIIDRGEAIENSTPLKMPMVMIHKDKAIEFRDNTKTERELVKFAVYLSMSSILGKKAFGFTNRQMIFARAFGFKDMNELQVNTPKKYLDYTGRRRIENIIDETCEEWNLHYSSGTSTGGIRGTYIGNGYNMNETKFLEMVAEKIVKLKNRKKDKRKALEQAVRRLSS